jgi:hypothetical protein
MSDIDYSNLILSFLTISNQIKLYHWQTKIHPRHVSTDKYFSKINELIDKFIETLIGRIIIEKKDLNYRLMLESNNKIILENYNDEDAFTFINNIKSYLEGKILKRIINESTDLQNIRDEMLSETNQLAYLFSLH